MRIMAIYHLSMQIISRGRGQSAVASASYRSGDRLTDERTGEEKFYRRDVQPDTMILAPANSPEWVKDRGQLWNAVEQIEKRKDSQLAREINVALPRELSNEKQKELIQNFVQNEFVNKGMIADIAIHRDDKENPHAHIMLTMRSIDENGFGKKNRDWNADFANSRENNRGFVKSSENCLSVREQWSNHANKALEKEGVQERISHLSHEARGLEQLPTVHLGHVAHEMEKRGVASDRGTINRDRQEHNRLVVDLQKYREEKQALEQKQAHQQAEKQKFERFSTAAERVDLQEASKLLNTKSTIYNINKKLKELDKWEESVNINEQKFDLKDKDIREASNHYSAIDSAEDQKQKAQNKIDEISWYSGFRAKHKATKDKANKEITKANDDIEFHNEKLAYHRKKLEFSTEMEFKQIEIQHKADTPGVLEQNRNDRQQILHQRDVLKKAETARQNIYIRHMASLYPERPEMRYMSYETAENLNQLNTANQKIVPIQAIEKNVTDKKQEITRLKGDISKIEQDRSRLDRAEGYLESYEKNHAIVNKYEDSIYLKNKMFISKKETRKYDDAVLYRKNTKDLMEKEGITGRIDFEKQIDNLSKSEAEVPEFKAQIQTLEKNLGIFDAIMKGLRIAGSEMQMEQDRQQQKVKSKSKTRSSGRGR